MNQPVSHTPQRRPVSHRFRLILYLTMGMMMASVAIAGYTFFSPNVGAAHVQNRPAHVATHVPATPPPTEPPILANANDRFATGDLAAMQAEMNAITRQVNTLMIEMQARGLVLSTDRKGQTPRPVAPVIDKRVSPSSASQGE